MLVLLRDRAPMSAQFVVSKRVSSRLEGVRERVGSINLREEEDLDSNCQAGMEQDHQDQ